MSPAKSFIGRLEEKEGHKYVFLCPSSISLSFAVWIFDDYTRKKPSGEVRVTLKEKNVADIKAVKNMSGYYVFCGLPEGNYTLRVESENYFPEERLVDTNSFVDSKEPVVEIFLRPRPSCHFPDRATLLRGMLAVEPDLLAGIRLKVTLKPSGLETWGVADERGEFVFYFREIIKGKAEVVLEIIAEGIGKTLSTSLFECQSTYIGIISIP